MLQRLLLLLAIWPLASTASELNATQIESCIAESQQLRVELKEQHKWHQQLNRQQHHLTELHQQLLEQKTHLEQLSQKLKDCSDGCNHIEAKLNGYTRKFDRNRDNYASKNQQFDLDREQLSADTAKRQLQFESYNSRCQVSSISAANFDKYCVNRNPESPFCSGIF
ncbi:hypothetical protein [Ferrimonas lipolytica]|uniref:Uncharacterized protein n=1 Tax=Ferrimonas lipolytica TaxID=2724191 RepID=A0A6H1UAU7_9GAMM|nr:hypothetical protein [Ferrimonas lipolytica]QIZ75958.1 hypothetical protein HER31_03105 [Ferrimonas lipolytica]